MKKVIVKTLIAFAVALIVGELMGHSFQSHALNSYTRSLRDETTYTPDWTTSTPDKTTSTPWEFNLYYFDKGIGYSTGIITFAVLLIIIMIPELRTPKEK